MSTANKILMGASGAGVGPSDDEFNRVSFLSHFDGSNDGVNNQFTDGSASNHTITANGNVTQGSFNPYGTNWSVDFSRDTNPRLSSPASSDFTLGTGDFTIEFFVFFYTIAGVQKAIKQDIASGQTGFTVATGDGTGKFTFGGVLSETTSDAVANKWYHIAITRNSGVFRIFRNGVQTDTDTSSVNFGSAAKLVYGGSDDLPIKGLMSNLRLVQGTSLYDSNFTTPTSPLTAVTNTKLLTLQSNRFVDNSASGHLVQPNTGTEKIGSFGPFLTSAVYDPAVNGASAYFDGSGDYLTVASSSDFDFGTSDFCWECWVFQTSRSAFQLIMAQDDYSSGNSISCWLTDTGQASIYYEGGGTHFTTTATVPLNTWTHLAWVRKGTGTNEFSIYINGTAEVSGTMTTSFDQDGIIIGQQANGSFDFNGYVSNIRIANGSHIYTSNFTPPTAPLTAVTNTKLLLNMADGQAIDSAAQHNLTLYGNAKISTGQAKFGNTSLYLDGSDDYLIVKNHQAYGTGPFTIEMFFRLDSVSGSRCLYDDRPDGASGDYISLIIASGAVNFYVGTTLKVDAGSISANTFYHIALCRSGTDTKLFLDGTQIGSTFSSDTTNYLNTGILRVGTNRSYSNQLAGYIDDFRISHMARYTSNFSPATEPFADKGQ